MKLSADNLANDTAKLYDLVKQVLTRKKKMGPLAWLQIAKMIYLIITIVLQINAVLEQQMATGVKSSLEDVADLDEDVVKILHKEGYINA